MNFKMNWGKGLIGVFCLFALGMGTLAYKASSTKLDLVSNEYYKDELRYQDKIDGMNNASKISVYDTLTNVKTELQGTFVPRTVIIAISGNEFIEARTDGTYLASIVDGVVSESKLLSPETKIVGLIF